MYGVVRLRGKESSVIKSTILLLVIQCVLLVLILTAYLMFSYRTAEDSLCKSARNILELYGRGLENKLESADLLLERLLYKNDDYDLLQSERESDRCYSAIRLKDLLVESISYDRNLDAVVIAESTYDTCLDYDNSQLSFAQREALRQFTMEQARNGNPKANFNVSEIGGKQYVYKLYAWRGLSAAVFISMDHFMDVLVEEELEGITFLLLDDNLVQGIRGHKAEQFTIGQTLDEGDSFTVFYEDFQLDGGSLSLVECVSKGMIKRQIGFGMIGILVMILLLVGFTLQVVRYIHKQIILPIGDLQSSMEQIQQGATNLRIEGKYSTTEFSLLKDTFNRLMDEIMGLKIEQYERQLELQQAELKSVKLQIRPHFFLNALTTISALNQQGRPAEVTTYINALSKNIRYMFRSGLHTVSLAEEMQHVENYFEMQELKYPGCVFYCVEMDPDTDEWQIPQMLIHTIIENEYKYAVSVERMLTILIKTSLVEVDGEQVLSIEIEDDGKGYPDDVIKGFAEDTDGGHIPRDGSRVGLWSLRKMLYLMYERPSLFQITNIIPHGCRNTFYIPSKPVHQIKETQNMKID